MTVAGCLFAHVLDLACNARQVINVSLASCLRMIDGPGRVSSSLRQVALR